MMGPQGVGVLQAGSDVAHALENDWMCGECKSERSRGKFSISQRTRGVGDRRCVFCTRGPDYEVKAMYRDANWFDEEADWSNVFDEKGIMYPKAQREGVMRNVRLKYVHAMRSGAVDQYSGGQARRGAPSSSRLVDQEAFRMTRYEARYWTPDEQRLKDLKKALGEDAIVPVRYFHFVRFCPWIPSWANPQDMFQAP